MADEDILPLLGVNIPEEEGSESESGGDDDEEDHEIRAIVNVTDEEDDSETQRESVSPRSAGEAASGRESGMGKKERRKSRVNYDQSLPSAHSYLGEDLEELHGRTIHDDDSWQRIPLLSFPGVVLIPGQIIPLQIFQPRIVSVLKRILETDRTFGVVPMSPGGTYSTSMADVGTTAEIISMKEDNDDSSGIDTMRVKAVGRQRFEIKERRREMDGSMSARVRILPEIELKDPLDGARPGSHERHLVAPVVKPITSIAVDKMGDYFKFQPTMSERKLDRLSAAHFTWWPPWVYKLYDTEFLMTKIKQELTSWNETLDVNKLPTDAVTFSFWVAANVPLDDDMKSRLLRINSAIQRLRYELNILQKYTILCCTNCDRQICNKKDIFTLAQEGPMGTYVNPGGYIHEMLTVLKTRGTSLRGRASEEHSWFPGYAWTIAECRYCSAHLGWQFTATKKKLKPCKFYGVTRASVTPGLVSADGDEDEHWVPVM